MPLSNDAKRILAQTLLGEAGGEGYDGMKAVAHVINNRARSGRFPGDPVSVAMQPKQFSTWNEGQGGNNPGRFGPGAPGYTTAMRAVDAVFGQGEPDPTGGATHYWSPSGMRAMGYASDPYWAADEQTQYGRVRIGNHTFLPQTQVGQPSQSAALEAINAAIPGAPPQRPTGQSAYASEAPRFDPTPIQTQEEVLRNVRIPRPRPDVGNVADAPTPPRRGSGLDVQIPRRRPADAPTSPAGDGQQEVFGRDFTGYLASKGTSVPAAGEMARMMERRRTDGAPRRESEFAAPIPPERPESLDQLSSISGGDAPAPPMRPTDSGNAGGLGVPSDTQGYLKDRLENPTYDPSSDLSQYASIYDAYQPAPPSGPSMDSQFGVADVSSPSLGPDMGVESPYSGLGFQTALAEEGTESASIPLPQARPSWAQPQPQATFASQDTQPSFVDTLMSAARAFTPFGAAVDFLSQSPQERERGIQQFFAGATDRPAILSRAPVDRRSRGVEAVNSLGSQDTYLTRRDYRMRGDDEDDHIARSVRRTNREIVGDTLTKENIERALREGKTLVRRR